MSILAFGPVRASSSMSDLKTELQAREQVSLQSEGYEGIDFRTRRQKKFDKRNHSKMSKKFGPIKMAVRLQNRRRSNLNLRLDLVETYEILNNTRNLQDLYTALQPDENYTLFGPGLRSDIKSVFDKVRNGLPRRSTPCNDEITSLAI